MDTVLSTDQVKWMVQVVPPPESQLDRIQRDIRQEQDNDKKLDHDVVAPALCHMPIEAVSVRVREHQHEERTPSGVVFWTAAGIVKQNERMQEFSKVADGRPKGVVEARESWSG